MSQPALRRGTEFTVPAGFADAVAAAAQPATSDDLLDVEGVRIGEFAGYQALLVYTPAASAAIALHGGHLLSYVPAGQPDVLWLSPRAKAPPDAIRGGVPVVWPYFGRQGQTDAVPSHGFARTVRWTIEHVSRTDEGAVAVSLALPHFPDLGLELRMELVVGDTLEQSLVTRNTRDETVTFTQALHSYFGVSDVQQVRVEGLDGVAYLDKNDGYVRHLQRGDWTLRDPRDPGRSDRIYNAAGGSYVLDDPAARRRLHVDVTGGATLVIWNPGEAAAARMTDVGDGWRGFLCLEAANAGGEVVVLEPGGTHRLTQRVRSVPDAG